MTKLSGPQRAALESAAYKGDATAHIQWGSAWNCTRDALQRRGYLDINCHITAQGRQAIGLLPLPDEDTKR